MMGELGRLAHWLKGDCVNAEEFAGLAVTEKVGRQIGDFFFLGIPI